MKSIVTLIFGKNSKTENEQLFYFEQIILYPFFSSSFFDFSIVFLNEYFIILN